MMKKVYVFVFFAFLSFGAWSQVSLTNGSPSALIDFSNTTPTGVGSNPSSAFAGAGFEAGTTTAGRLNSNAWAVTGWSNGDLAFGGTQTTASTDYTRGVSTVAVTTGGMYAYTGTPGSVANPSLMMQPGGSDWAPGTLTLRIQNNGTSNITQLVVSYNIYVRNDQGRSNSFNFSHSADNVTYTPVPALDYTSTATADGLGWVVIAGAPSRSTTITGLAVAPGSYFYIRWSGADVGGAVARDEFGLDDINVTATFSSGATPDVTLSSPNPAVAAGNVTQGAINHAIYHFDLAVASADATLSGVTINTAGTYLVADFTNFKCWYSADAVFSPGTDVELSTLSPVAAAGPQVFPAFVNQVILSGATGYIFISADLPCNATLTNNISVNAITTAGISFLSANKTGTAFAGGLQTIIAATPVDVSAPAASVANMSSNLTWTNPTGCYDEIMIVASATLANTGGAPTGDGTAYTDNLAYGAGIAFGNGFVVYKGAASGQTVTGLTNGTPYFYKFFTRFGTTWSAGIEISATPAVVTLSTDYFRSKQTGDWGLAANWESSSDNISWMDATLVPDFNANTITVRNGHIITVALPQSADQLVVEAGATLALVNIFTVADGTGTDMSVSGTVINTLPAGNHVVNGTIAFNAGSLYQHGRDGGTIIPATWAATSTAEITGVISATSIGGANQSFGNFTWNSVAQTANLNLTGNLATVNGNFRVQNTGIAELRLTGSANLNLFIGEDFIIEADLNMDNNASGISQIALNGNFNHSAGNFSSSAGLVTISFNFNGLVVKTFTQSGGTFTNENINWYISDMSEITLNSDLLLATSRSLEVAGGILNCGVFAVKGTGSIIVGVFFGTASRVRVGSLSAGGTVNDNLSASGGLTLGGFSVIEYNGLAPQVAAARTYPQLEINNANGVTLTGPVVVNTWLYLTSGIVTTTAANLLTMAAGTDYSGGTTNTNYVSGPMKKIGNTPFIFPVGKTVAPDGGIAQIGVGNFVGGAVTDEFIAEYRRGSARALGAITAVGLDHVSGCDYWTLDLTNGTPTVDVTCYWSSNNTCSGAVYVTSLPDLVIAHFNGTNWDAFGTVGTASGTPAAGNVVWSSVSTFSPFSLGSVNFTNPLPINVNYITGQKQNGKHLLNWKVTCVSTPSATLELQRSSDGRDYNTIYSIFATALRCADPFDYIDNQPVKGINYYRLKMTSVDGKVSYSTIVHLINATSGTDILNIAPNPIKGGRFDLRVSTAENTKMDFLITDMQGRLLHRQSASLVSGFNTIPVNVQQLAAGTYQLHGYTAEGKTRVLRFVIR